MIRKYIIENFDYLYSEFHLGRLNNPIIEKSEIIFNQFLNYTKNKGIETYEEEIFSKINARDTTEDG